VVLMALVLAAALGVGGWVLATGDGGGGTAQGPGTSTTPTAAPAADGPAEPPAGWQVFEGGPGWQVAVPPNYALGTFDGQPQYKDQDTGRTLRVDTTPAGGGVSDVVADRRRQAADFAATHEDYVELGISAVDYRGLDAADWEFTYSDGGASLHALSRVFVVDRRGYSLFFQTRASDDWAAARAQFEQMAASFRLP